jgi:hypothetical protein
MIWYLKGYQTIANNIHQGFLTEVKGSVQLTSFFI